MSLHEFLRQLKVYTEIANSPDDTFQRRSAITLLTELREILNISTQAQVISGMPFKVIETKVPDLSIFKAKKKGRQPMKSTQLPKDFKISESVTKWLAEQEGSVMVDIEKEFLAFKDFHLSKGNVFKDWDAAFRTWLRNAIKFNAGKGNNKPSGWKDGVDFDKEFKK